MQHSTLDELRNKKHPAPQIARLSREMQSLLRKNVEMNTTDEAAEDFGNTPYYGYDGEILRIVISPIDLFEQFGVHAHVIGLDDDGVIQYYMNAQDGKIYAGSGAVILDYNGLTLFNGAVTDAEASVNLPDLGWIANQIAIANGETRQFRIGMRDNGTEPEAVIQYFEPGNEITIDNYNFGDLDMTGWTEVERGVAKVALGTLSTAFSVFQIVFFGDDIYATIQSGSTGSSVWKWTAATQTWAAYGNLSTAFATRGIAVIGSDIYVAGGGFSTSSVWVSVAGADFVAYGTLSTAFDVKDLLVVGSDLYASRSSGVWTTSSVWVSVAGGAWAAYGTLSTAFTDIVLLLVGSDIYAGIRSSATTSSVWKSASGGAWAAYGTLSTSFTIRSLAAIGSDIYAGISNGATTSAVWKSAGGGAWAAYGTLSTSFEVWGLVAIGNDLYASGRSFTTSGIWKSYNGGAWASFGNFATTLQVAHMIANGYDLYLAIGTGGSTLTSNVWTIDQTSWDASAGYATVTNTDTTVPEIEMATRFAVNVGDRIELRGSTMGQITGGTLIFTVGIKFYTASSGGSLVSTTTAFTRTLTADGALQEKFGYITVPATATHAAVYGKFSNTAGIVTVGVLDRFKAGIVNGAFELILKDSGLWQQFNSRGKTRIDGTIAVFAPAAVGPSNNAETDIASVTIPGGLMGTTGLLTFEMWLEYFNNSGAGRTFVIRMYYGATGVVMLSDTLGASATYRGGVNRFFMKWDGATNSQFAYGDLNNSTGLSGLNTPAGGVAGPNKSLTLAIDSTVDQTFRITLQHGASNANLAAYMRHGILKGLSVG